MTPTIIGLTGPAGSGKDTVAFFLNGFQRCALADPIRMGLSAIFELPPNTWNDRETKEKVIPFIGRSPRQLMQTLGTEWGRRHVSPDIWLDLMLRRWEEIKLQPVARMVVTDVRFDNEAAAIINVGGTVWRVVRPDVAAVSAHPSEAGVSTAHIKGTIVNNGSLAELREQCDHLRQLLGVLPSVDSMSKRLHDYNFPGTKGAKP
jgi:hypothetical protein